MTMYAGLMKNAFIRHWVILPHINLSPLTTMSSLLLTVHCHSGNAIKTYISDKFGLH
jgi:hypothetical protein